MKNVFISTYTFIYNGIRTNNSGPVIPLMNFFKKRASVLYMLEQPLPGSDSMDTIFTVFQDGKEVEFLRKNFFFSKMPKKRLDSNKTYMRLKLRDMFSNFYFMLKKLAVLRKEKAALFIGLESINTICGIIMRRLGLVDRVVYYIFDWAPDRYQNPIMNRLYLFLDKIATYYSDYTWNITYTIGEARKNILGYNEEKMSPQLYVPYCVNFDKKWILPDERIDPNLVVYSGGLIEENGAMLLVEAYRLVQERFPESRLLIIGGGYGLEKEMKEYVKRHGMDRNVEFTGYIADEAKIMEMQSRCAIGVAPYPIMKGSRKPFGDVIKIRMYFACGLVTISTPVPPSSKEIAEERLGYRTADDSPEEIAMGICMFLENKNLLYEYRKNVVNKARLSNWENNYSHALAKMNVPIVYGNDLSFKGNVH